MLRRVANEVACAALLEDIGTVLDAGRLRKGRAKCRKVEQGGRRADARAVMKSHRSSKWSQMIAINSSAIGPSNAWPNVKEDRMPVSAIPH